jgi:hypothetical protein
MVVTVSSLVSFICFFFPFFYVNQLSDCSVFILSIDDEVAHTSPDGSLITWSSAQGIEHVFVVTRHHGEKLSLIMDYRVPAEQSSQQHHMEGTHQKETNDGSGVVDNLAFPSAASFPVATSLSTMQPSTVLNDAPSIGQWAMQFMSWEQFQWFKTQIEQEFYQQQQPQQQEQVKHAFASGRQQGYQQGQNEGYQEGYREGYKEAFQQAYKQAYNQALEHVGYVPHFVQHHPSVRFMPHAGATVNSVSINPLPPGSVPAIIPYVTKPHLLPNDAEIQATKSIQAPSISEVSQPLSVPPEEAKQQQSVPQQSTNSQEMSKETSPIPPTPSTPQILKVVTARRAPANSKTNHVTIVKAVALLQGQH